MCGFAAAFGCRRPAKSRSVQINMFIRTVGRFCRYNTLKTARSGKQSLLRTMLEKRGQKGKFFRRQKFALLLKELAKLTGFQRRF
ncbi:MAG: hypothetical protein PHT50_05850 [Candidatus Omnitrophica bacterium]|nr:hypothetical protein [Candidatus Omnitrophota bacterium]